MKLKVCGMRNADNLSDLLKIQPDFIGFIFYENSLRNVTDFPIVDIPKSIKKVGVFVNEWVGSLIDVLNKYQLDGVQLHGGTETVGYCKELKKRAALGNKKIEIIKAFSVDDTFDFEVTQEYEEVCDYFLFDTKGKYYGGNGEKFTWDILSKYNGKTPYLLSGGISLVDVDAIDNFLKTAASKHCIGLDVNSGFEIDIALKNIEELREFKDNLSNLRIDEK